MAYNLTSLFYNAHLQTSILRIQVKARTNHVTVHLDCRHCVDLSALCRCFRQRRQTSKMSMSDQRKMLRCRVDRLIRCHTRSMHSNRHGRKQSLWSIKIVWLKTYNVKPFWCVTSSVHAEFAIHRIWCEWHWDMVGALLKGDARIACLCRSQFSLYNVSHNPRSWQWCHEMFHTRMTETTYV